jgi:hypothetical protein
MIKTIIGLMGLMVMLSSSSCKNDTGTLEYWIFQDTTYGGVTCSQSGATISCVNGGGIATHPLSNSMNITFGAGLVPVSGGTYTVSDTAISSTQVSIRLDLHYNTTTTTGGTSYISTGGNGRNQTVQVSTSTTGITISGVKIMMRNAAPPGDSAALDFNISPLN